MKRYLVNLSASEREELQRLTTTGRAAAQKVKHAHILLKADDGLTDAEISVHLNVGVRTIERVRQRCVVEGIAAALDRRKQPLRAYALKLDGEAEARLVQVACSEAPDGRCKWTLRLLADKLVELEVVDSISHETVRQRLKKTKSNPGE
jgi:transposase